MTALLRRRIVSRIAPAIVLAGIMTGAAAAQDAQTPIAAAPPPAVLPSIRITSPLGRTGIASAVRIVAQVTWPATVDPRARTLRLRFLVDDSLVGTVDDGPPYAVTWVDENPFEPRSITVEGETAGGAVVRDTVRLAAVQVTSRTDVASIVVDAAVFDERGHPARGLTARDFAVRENDSPQTIDLVTPESVPTTTLLLVDNSESMAGRFEGVRHAVERFGRNLAAHDVVIVAPFTRTLGAITGPTSDVATIAESVAAMHAGGGTAILNAIQQATHMLDGVDGRRAIVLISDGFDENSTIDLETAVRAAEARQITVYSVALGGVTGVSLGGERTLRRITDATGGRAFFPWREQDLQGVTDQIEGDAHNRYLIAYTPANQKKDGTFRRITIGAPRGYTVRAREGYLAALPPPIRPTLEFVVTDRTSAYADITVDDLRVVEDGTPQAIDTFQEAVDPVSIVLLLDASGSMTRAAEAVKGAARAFVAAVRPEDSLAMITFADEPQFAHVLSTNRAYSASAIDKYEPGGGTALYDGLWNALMTLKPVAGRRAVVVLTDGRDENRSSTGPGSAHTLEDVLSLQRQVGATTFTIGLGSRVDGQVLKTLASGSGGDAYLAPAPDELAAQFRRIVEDLRRRYVIGYTSTNAEADGRWRHVDIVPVARGLVIRGATGYFAPEP